MLYLVHYLVQQHDISHIPENNRICDVNFGIVTQTQLLTGILSYCDTSYSNGGVNQICILKNTLLEYM
jgi:hypothetical protein